MGHESGPLSWAPLPQSLSQSCSQGGSQGCTYFMAFTLQGSLKKKKKTPADPTRGYSVTSKARLEEQLLSVSLLGCSPKKTQLPCCVEAQATWRGYGKVFQLIIPTEIPIVSHNVSDVSKEGWEFQGVSSPGTQFSPVLLSTLSPIFKSLKRTSKSMILVRMDV